MELSLKPPITYYGGKQLMVKLILPLIPKHILYCEAFAGGLAVFWAKDKSQIEVINDLNSEVANFYRVIQQKQDELELLVKATLHSRKDYENAMVMYDNPHLFTDVQRAWAFWVACNQSYSSRIGAGWSYERKEKNRCAIAVKNKRERITDAYSDRLSEVSIERRDALKIIESRDSEDTFFYLDPPYPNACQGHYAGYSEANFVQLIDLLTTIKGKFLLSSYPLPVLTETVKRLNWYQKEFNMSLSITNHKRRKIEVLTANYEI